MLFLKREIKTYLKNKSIKWDRVDSKLRAIISVGEGDTEAESIAKDNAEFISKLGSSAPLSFNFVDTDDGEKKVLVVTNPKLSSEGNIMVEALTVTPQKEIDDSEVAPDGDSTPFYVDNEWYKNSRGTVYRWLGKVDDSENSKHKMKNIETEKEILMTEDQKDKLKRVEPSRTQEGKFVLKR